MREELVYLSADQVQAVSALRLLLEGLEREGGTIAQGSIAAELFAARLRLYIGALHFIADRLEENGESLEDLAEKGEGT